MAEPSADRNPTKVDVLVFGAHPDDADIGTGGLLLKLHDAGRKSAIVDVTAGEMASSGTVEVRKAEAEEARKILGVDYRENMGLPDCGVEDTPDNRCRAAELIRKYQPTIVLSPYFEARPPGRGIAHVDHHKTGLIVSNAHNYAHLAALPIQGKPWFAKCVLYYGFIDAVRPTFVVDFTPYFDRYMRAIQAHKSQFGVMFGNADQVRRMMGLLPFESLARFFGQYAGGGFSHGFYSPDPLVIGDVLSLAERSTIMQQVDRMREQERQKQTAESQGL